VLGALDLVCLCVPSAAVCLAVWVLATLKDRNRYSSGTDTAEENKCNTLPPTDDELTGVGDKGEGATGSRSGHKRLGWRGFVSAVLYGDFVEACYPYTLSDPALLVVVRVGSAVAGAVVVSQGVRSSAYLPIPFALLLTGMSAHVDTGGKEGYWATVTAALLYAIIVSFFFPFVFALYRLRTRV